MAFSNILGGREREQVTTQEYKPAQAEQFNELFRQASNFLGSEGPNVSASTGINQDAVSQYRQASQALAGNVPQVQQAQNTLFAAGNPGNNPALQEYIQFLNDELGRSASVQLGNLGATENVIAGTPGGSSRNKLSSMVIEDLLRQQGGQTAGLLNQAYGQGLNSVATGLQLNPVVNSAITQPANATTVAGGLQRGIDLDPYQLGLSKLQSFRDLINVNAGGTTTNTTPFQTGGLAGALGGLSAGAGAASLLPESMAGASPYITGGAALLGLLT